MGSVNPKRAETTKKFSAKRPDGKRQCVWCAKERPKNAAWLKWCSEACAEDYRVRAWPAHAAKRVFERDNGVCAGCGVDTERIRKWLALLPRPFFGHRDITLGRSDRYSTANRNGRVLGLHRDRAMTILGRWWGRRITPASHLYEVDHIKPVAEGGGGCGLDNLRTLCLKCHARETRALHARLKKARAK